MALAKIVFASMTGNTEEIADIVADKLRDLGLDVDVDECTTVDASDFLEADIAIVATYTYGCLLYTSVFNSKLNKILFAVIFLLILLVLAMKLL